VGAAGEEAAARRLSTDALRAEVQRLTAAAAATANAAAEGTYVAPPAAAAAAADPVGSGAIAVEVARATATLMAAFERGMARQEAAATAWNTERAALEGSVRQLLERAESASAETTGRIATAAAAAASIRAEITREEAGAAAESRQRIGRLEQQLQEVHRPTLLNLQSVQPALDRL